jgi:hypothetical protein
MREKTSKGERRLPEEHLDECGNALSLANKQSRIYPRLHKILRQLIYKNIHQIHKPKERSYEFGIG